MFISLRESSANGFRRWSDLQQQKYGQDRATNVNSRIGFPKALFDVTGMTRTYATAPSDKVSDGDIG